MIYVIKGWNLGLSQIIKCTNHYLHYKIEIVDAINILWIETSNKTPFVQMPLCVSKDRQMRGEEFLKLVGSLKRSEMQVGSSIP